MGLGLDWLRPVHRMVDLEVLGRILEQPVDRMWVIRRFVRVRTDATDDELFQTIRYAIATDQ